MRDSEPKVSKVYASLSANIRLRMKQYTREVQQLKSKVEEASKLRTMYPLSLHTHMSGDSLAFVLKKLHTLVNFLMVNSLKTDCTIEPLKRLNVEQDKWNSYKAGTFSCKNCTIRVQMIM